MLVINCLELVDVGSYKCYIQIQGDGSASWPSKIASLVVQGMILVNKWCTCVSDRKILLMSFNKFSFLSCNVIENYLLLRYSSSNALLWSYQSWNSMIWSPFSTISNRFAQTNDAWRFGSPYILLIEILCHAEYILVILPLINTHVEVYKKIILIFESK